MPNQYYQRTGKSLPGYRELFDNEFPKWDDLLWTKNQTMLKQGGNQPSMLFQSQHDFIQLHNMYVHGTLLTKYKACDFVDALVTSTFGTKPENQTNITKRKYSLWRKKMSVPKHPWQYKPLPLP